MLENVKSSEDYTPQKDYLIKALLLGGSGSGKTTGAMSLPGKKLLVDLDNRAESVAGFPNLDIIKILGRGETDPTPWTDLGDLITELWKKEAEGLPWDAIIIDGLTMMGRYAMNWVMERALTADGKKLGRGPGGSPAQPHYQPQMTLFSRAVLGLLPLPCHVVFTGHLDMYEDKTLNTLHYWPKVIGKTRTEISNWFNETYECKKIEGVSEVEYHWYTIGTGRSDFIKSSINTLGKYWEDPVIINFRDDYGQSEKTGFEKLLQIRFGGGD